MDLTLNKLKMLICHKNPTKQQSGLTKLTLGIFVYFENSQLHCNLLRFLLRCGTRPNEWDT